MPTFFCFTLTMEIFLFQLSWADILFVALLDVFKFMGKVDLSEGRPNIQGLVKTVLEVPQIKSWIANRPVTSI